MVKLNKISTKTGDAGDARLDTGEWRASRICGSRGTAAAPNAVRRQ